MAMVDGMFVGETFDFDKEVDLKSKIDEYIKYNKEVEKNVQKNRK